MRNNKDGVPRPEKSSDLLGAQYTRERGEDKYGWHSELDPENTRAAREPENQKFVKEEDGKRMHSTRFFEDGKEVLYHGYDEGDKRDFHENPKPDTFSENLNKCNDEIENG
jgi:hypothetical protein